MKLHLRKKYPNLVLGFWDAFFLGIIEFFKFFLQKILTNSWSFYAQSCLRRNSHSSLSVVKWSEVLRTAGLLRKLKISSIPVSRQIHCPWELVLVRRRRSMPSYVRCVPVISSPKKDVGLRRMEKFRRENVSEFKYYNKIIFNFFYMNMFLA